MKKRSLMRCRRQQSPSLLLRKKRWKSGKGAPPKTQLDVAKVQAITDAVLLEFPQATASDVRAAIRRKCNNEQFVQKKV
ncbi:hypothetical protein Q8A67_024218 [Cirrhinus molitorella]|uniref:Uncharacterized protein n=1 Tax=Cirrhinus molitorella TaxID=172907 RepID=A0AA88NY49_9TELE|nr:hypothetical protein Q8A67_024218 [Cirrhinus molitorella]